MSDPRYGVALLCNIIGIVCLFVAIFLLKKRYKNRRYISFFLRDFKTISRLCVYRIVYTDYIEISKKRFEQGLGRVVNSFFSQNEVGGVGKVVIDFYYDCDKICIENDKIIFPVCMKDYSYDSKKINYSFGKKAKLFHIFGRNIDKDVILQKIFKEELKNSADQYVKTKIAEYNIYENIENRVKLCMHDIGSALNKNFCIEFQREEK